MYLRCLLDVEWYNYNLKYYSPHQIYTKFVRQYLPIIHYKQPGIKSQDGMKEVGKLWNRKQYLYQGFVKDYLPIIYYKQPGIKPQHAMKEVAKMWKKKKHIYHRFVRGYLHIF